MASRDSGREAGRDRGRWVRRYFHPVRTAMQTNTDAQSEQYGSFLETVTLSRTPTGSITRTTSDQPRREFQQSCEDIASRAVARFLLNEMDLETVHDRHVRHADHSRRTFQDRVDSHMDAILADLPSDEHQHVHDAWCLLADRLTQTAEQLTESVVRQQQCPHDIAFDDWQLGMGTDALVKIVDEGMRPKYVSSQWTEEDKAMLDHQRQTRDARLGEGERGAYFDWERQFLKHRLRLEKFNQLISQRTNFTEEEALALTLPLPLDWRQSVAEDGETGVTRRGSEEEEPV